jgi:hypothetical protein
MHLEIAPSCLQLLVHAVLLIRAVCPAGSQTVQPRLVLSGKIII